MSENKGAAKVALIPVPRSQQAATAATAPATTVTSPIVSASAATTVPTPAEALDNEPYISAFSERQQELSFLQECKRKFSSNPFIPIGAGMTCVALVGGLYAFKRGNQRHSQLYQRARVFFQLSTIGALVAGGYVNHKQKTEQNDVPKD
eukprot:m.225821 g.225821  ORF g.225821 m.225821 type:complete len:149 (-) comp54214_c0_seq6:39-485(-)